ncbi:MAG: TonB family protein [Gammaproteobacteria bacterium]|nr:TonB family protein [Gammaproteobacteria bacterium]MDH5652552.1 TonB family protein [Gammaproteobacteria bacterium]
MDLGIRHSAFETDLRPYEKRLSLALVCAVAMHGGLAWWFSDAMQTAVPTLPDWMEVKLVARVERSEPPQPERKPQTVKPLANNRQQKAEPKATPQSQPAVQSQDNVRTRKQAKPVDNPKPLYPAAAKRRGMQGTVLLQLAVSERGKVTAVQLKQSSGFRLLDTAAIDSVWSWRFQPALEDEEQIASEVIIPIRFELRDM